MLKGYLDTCIVSGLAKSDLSPVDREALLRILEARVAGKVELLTSEVTRAEIAKIPKPHRTPHTAIYSLLAGLPLAATHRSVIPRFAFLGARFPPGWRADPLFTELNRLLPDPGDAEHVFQAAKNNVTYLITVDRRSLLSRSSAVAQLCSVKLVTPAQFEQAMLVTG